MLIYTVSFPLPLQVPRRSRSCPKVLMEIEKRAEERRKSQEERSKQRKLKQDAKQDAWMQLLRSCVVVEVLF
jgi:hypothetical protein